MLAEEKVMPEKKPILALAEEKVVSDEQRCWRKTSRSRSPPPPSFLPGYHDAGPESDIATAGEHVDKMSECAWRRSTHTTIAICRAHPAARRAATASTRLPFGCPLAAAATATSRLSLVRRGVCAAGQCPCRALLPNVRADTGMPRARARRNTNEKMQTANGDVGSGGFCAGRGGVDKLSGSWRVRVAESEAKAATPAHWASIEGRRKRQHDRKGRRSKRARRILEARVADGDDGKSADAREQPDYGMRGRDDHDACYADHEYDTIWGDTIIASLREPCASPPVRKLDFEAIARRLKPVSPPLEPSTPAPASVLTAPETAEPPPLLRQQGADALVGHAALPAQKLDFEAIELEPIESPSEPHAEPSVPASVSALQRPCPTRSSTLTSPHRPTPQRQ